MESDRAVAIGWAVVALLMLLAAALGALAGHFQPTDAWAPPESTSTPVMVERVRDAGAPARMGDTR